MVKLLDRIREDGVVETMAARRQGQRSRMFRAGCLAVCLTPVIGWTLAILWLALYSAVQALDFALFGSESARRRPFSKGLALTWLAVNSLVFGAPVLFTSSKGSWGLVYGLMLLVVGMLTPLMTNQGSRAAIIAALAPFAGYLLFVAYTAGKISGSPIIAISAVALCVVIVNTARELWRSGSDSRDARKRAHAEADRRRLEAEAATAAKSSFIAMVSHELRTPISAILAGAEAIERSAGPKAATRSNAALIAESGRMMRTLLNDLLDLSKMEAGRMDIEVITYDLPALISDSVAFWSAEAAKKGLYLELEGVDVLPSHVAGDPTRLRQILNNLFSNAIKFTDHGGVTLSVLATRLEEDVRLPNEDAAWMARFTVADSGDGMSSDQIARLFTPFEQTQTSIARTHGGTGLGLTISRELARLMGGDLYARSRPGEGASFTLEIALADARPMEDAAAETLATSVEDVRVLVVDDHEVNRRAVALMLEPFGVQLSAASSARAALEQLSAHVFDVVLMDVHMPVMDGREACRMLRRTPGPNQHTPVIACTASSEATEWEACRQAGMTGHVAKPIDAAALHAAIARALIPVSIQATAAA
ncbi:response regulator [Phenylobacterium sp.]|uniref:response regulator n=1 Tax=Phenylobacterium sp. TaxID=1871053 RepID=UPI002736AA0B|nr:response regulator [Phenylobacterium sp.]MDP3661121.1 response regulator [Phenylobacterium sp.]